VPDFIYKKSIFRTKESCLENKTKIGDMTTEEFKALIAEAVEEKLKALFFDPDHGCELKEETEVRLKASLNSKERFMLEEVKNKLGLV